MPVKSLTSSFRTMALSGVVLVGLQSAPALACNVDVAPLSFGTINALEIHDTDSTTTITVTCPAATTYTATAGAGTGSYAERQMTAAQGHLDYQLYTEASRSLVWGDGSAGTNTLAGTAGPTGDTQTVYGRVPAQPLAIPGTYADTILVTISY
jgi:spore coat protein U-like protein